MFVKLFYPDISYKTYRQLTLKTRKLLFLKTIFSASNINVKKDYFKNARQSFWIKILMLNF